MTVVPGAAYTAIWKWLTWRCYINAYSMLRYDERDVGDDISCCVAIFTCIFLTGMMINYWCLLRVACYSIDDIYGTNYCCVMTGVACFRVCGVMILYWLLYIICALISFLLLLFLKYHSVYWTIVLFYFIILHYFDKILFINFDLIVWWLFLIDDSFIISYCSLHVAVKLLIIIVIFQ